MTGHDSADVARVIRQLQVRLAEPVDFTDSSPDASAAKVRLLSAAAIYFNVLAVTEYGGRIGPIRQEGLVEQIVAAAFQTYHGVDPHPTPFDKAAMLLRGVTQGHPFTDGNKRTGFLLAVYFLECMGFSLRPHLPVAEVVSFCRRVSAGEIRDLETMAATLHAWHER